MKKNTVKHLDKHVKG